MRKIRIRWTHIFNLLIQFPIWLGSIVFGGILAAIPYFLATKSGGFIDILSIILLIIAVSIGSVYLYKWLQPFATKWYLKVSCETDISYSEANDLTFLFDGSLGGKWYPFKDLINIPKEYRKKILYEFAEKLTGRRLKTNPYYSKTNNTYANNNYSQTYTQNNENKTYSENEYSNNERQKDYTTNEQHEKPKTNEQKYSNDYISACKTMGLNYNFSKEELKNKYRELMKQYHPDLFVNSNPEIKNIAETTTRQINSAYEYLSNI